MDKKGIDMVFKGAQKKYPFLVDWFLGKYGYTENTCISSFE
jgi:hypothetical protein